jgi:iron complex outermembrane receptor protein
MKFKALIGTSILAMAVATPAWAQDPAEEVERDAFGGEIVVTAQRQSERLQDVPIAVSAFSTEALEAQQIKTPSDLQLTLPNVTFTKTNFTGASFTIRGIGDLCVGTTCDSATAIHLNGDPLFSTRLFETEFYDLERIEVLRGPQGTLFGRNATSGVVNVITAKPKLGTFEAAAEAEYGNYDSMKGKAMVNIPLGDTMAFRVAGIYLNRDGYTKNTFLDTRIDDRDLYSVRGSLRWEPSDDTTIDILASYFREKDQRTRIQKQQCQRDPTGILGCLNTRLDNSPFNGNATFTAALTSREFLAIRGIPTAFALGSLYGPDVYANTTVPEDPRTVNTAYTPSYFTSELTIQGQIEHNFGPVSLQVSGQYQKVKLDASQDYNSNVGNRALYAGGLATLQAAANGGLGAGFTPYFAPVAAAIIPNGPTGQLCTSLAEETGYGSYGGNKICSDQSLQFDRSNQYNSSWSVEGILSSDLDGPFNFLVGGIYADYHLTENSYYVNAFPIDYLTGVLGGVHCGDQSAGRRWPTASVVPRDAILPQQHRRPQDHLLRSVRRSLFRVQRPAETDRRSAIQQRQKGGDGALDAGQLPGAARRHDRHGVRFAVRRIVRRRPRHAGQSDHPGAIGQIQQADRTRGARFQDHRRQSDLCVLLARLQIGRHQPAAAADLCGARKLPARTGRRVRNRLEEQLR